MTGADAAASLAEMLDERRHLLEIAVRMFGEAAAERIVHETYGRWYALDDDERARISTPRAWLTRTAGGICLDLLASSARPLGDPPSPGGPAPRPDPVTAWARRHPRQEALLARHDHVVRRFAAAWDAGDTATLTAILAADAMAVSDGGGKVRAPVHPTHGAGAVARYVTTLLAGRPRTAVTVESVNGRAGLALRRDGTAVAVVSLSVAGGEVTAVWIVVNPDKLRRWNRR
jgi:RNA polymerase sigma-70 factor (ECF subfamily)